MLQRLGSDVSTAQASIATQRKLHDASVVEEAPPPPPYLPTPHSSPLPRTPARKPCRHHHRKHNRAHVRTHAHTQPHALNGFRRQGCGRYCLPALGPEAAHVTRCATGALIALSRRRMSHYVW
jgi:hypothetical protein